jgi:1,4-alpha-glucan branching enzyme
MTKAKRNHHPTLNQAAFGLKLVEVIFSLRRPKVQEVFVSGDFNEWPPVALRMIRRGDDGPLEQRLTLPPGRCQYKFIVDVERLHDPNATGNVANQHGSLKSVVEVRR